MYQFYAKTTAKPPTYALKIRLSLKLTAFIILAALLHCSATIAAQRISLTVKNAPLKTVLDKITDQTDVDFLVSTRVLKISRPVTLKVKEEALNIILDRIFSQQPLRYEIQEKTVIISEKIPAPPPVPAVPAVEAFRVSGQVTDSTGVALPGAAVSVSGSERMTLTDKEGNFTIEASAGELITISFIGYRPFTFRVTGPLPFQKIILKTVSEVLEQVGVVSNGYQTVPKERATGSFTTPLREVFNARVSTGVLERLQGITSGLSFNATPGGTDPARPDISIRGRSTIYSNDQPLIVVNNFPYNGSLADLNPQDVESVTVLKDAAAASIWGVKAGNGVIVITTKQGKLNQPLSVALTSNVTIGERPDLRYDPNFLPSTDYIDLQQTLFRLGRYDADLTNVRNYPVIPAAVEIMAARRSGTITAQDSAARINTLKGVDIRDGLGRYYYRRMVNQQYALNISSGGSRATQYFSAGYDRNQSAARSVWNERLTLGYSTTFRPVDRLEVSAQLNYVNGNTYSGQPVTLANATSVSNTFFPYTSFVTGSGDPAAVNRGYSNAYKQAARGNNFLNWDYVPLAEFGANQSRTNTNDTRVLGNVRYRVLKGLHADIKYQCQRYASALNNRQGLEMYTTRDLINQYSVLTNGKVSGYNVPVGDVLFLTDNRTTSQNFRGQLGYDKNGLHELHLLAGAEMIQYRNYTSNNKFYGYDQSTDSFTPVNPLGTFPLNPRGNGVISGGDGITNGTDRFRSYYFTGSYTYDTRYTLSGSARQDGSNYFGVSTNQKTVPLWSVGGKWNIDKESFYNVSWLPSLQLRLTYGSNGNLNRTVTGITTFLYQTGSVLTNLPYATISNIGNPDLRWEKNSILNAAVDFALMKRRLSGSIEFFWRKGTDLIGNQLLAPSIGYVNPATGTYVLTGNFASMKGRGIDLTLSSANIKGVFSWNSDLNLSFARDEVTQYDQLSSPSYSAYVGGSFNILPAVGKPVNALYSYRFAGLNPFNGDPQGYVAGKISTDYAALTTPAKAEDISYEGPTRPRIFGGLSNRFQYKRLSLICNLTFKLDYVFRRTTLAYATLFSTGAAHQDYLNRWQRPGDENSTTIPSLRYPADSNRDLFYQFSEATVEQGDHIRFQDLSLNYELVSSTGPGRLPFSSLQVYSYINNVGILWRANRKGLDPDFSTGGIPYIRTVSFGLKARF